MADLLSLPVAGTTVKTVKITDIKSARKRIIMALEKQHKYWLQFMETEDTSAIDFVGRETKRSLWFKKMSKTEDYMFKVLLGNLAIYANDDAREKNNSWFIDIPKLKMSDYLKESIKNINDGNWDGVIKPTLDSFLANQAKMQAGKKTTSSNK